MVQLQGRANEFVLDFNLALCYVGTRQFQNAADLLNRILSAPGHDTPEVGNLLAQALIGEGKPDLAMAAFQRSASRAPKNEKLYLFLAAASMEAGYYDFGLIVVNQALQSLPKSARLLFERGMFLSQMDQFDAARADFHRAAELAPGTDVAYIAGAEEAMFAGNVADAKRIAREGIEKGNMHFLLLTIFGEAVLKTGVTPGQPDFADAQQALEKVVAEHPNLASAQLTLGQLYLQGDRLDDAITHLEAARRLEPENASVFSNLATAYKRHGDNEKAQVALDALARINQEQVEKIATTPGERKAGYATRVPSTNPPKQ